ncbi:MAG: hypothetical protein LLG40_11335 [Deltaproteobacteria bacterium]|nr:hypothetical protein [Deltaproteobacteria bacterium]
MTASKIPKTGVATIMRDWMKARKGTITERKFTTKEMGYALAIMQVTGEIPIILNDRARMRDALKDFIKRGEVKVITYKNRKHRYFIYVPDFNRELKDIINKKIFKAMYVSGTFSMTDIKRLTHLKDRNYLDKIARKLSKDGYLQAISRRNLTGGGRETVWHIVNRDKFNLEKPR